MYVIQVLKAQQIKKKKEQEMIFISQHGQIRMKCVVGDNNLLKRKKSESKLS